MVFEYEGKQGKRNNLCKINVDCHFSLFGNSKENIEGKDNNSHYPPVIFSPFWRNGEKMRSSREHVY